MDEFRIQRAVFRELRSSKPRTEAGMRLAIERVAATPHGRPWRECVDLDWGRGQRAWNRWFNDLLRRFPLPAGTSVLWFEVPSELSSASTSVSAYKRLGAARDNYGLNEPRTWPIDDLGFTVPEGLLKLPELERALVRVGWRDAEGDEQEKLAPGVHAISFGYVALLVINGLAAVPRVLQRSPDGVAVVQGWVEGGVEPLGRLSSRGWASMPRVAPRRPNREELDPSSHRFDLKRYLREGGDPNWRDAKTGETLLMRAVHESPATIQSLIAAGASVRMLDNGGRNVLHTFGAADPGVLAVLLEGGASVNQINRDGFTALDSVLQDGRCTVKHLKLLLSNGAKLRGTLQGGSSPLFEAASHTLYERSRKKVVADMIRFWVRRGHDINRRRRDGLTPLWVALRMHAQELVEHTQWLRRNVNAGGTWDYQSDAVAVMLIEQGADPNSRYMGKPQRLIPPGATPLMVQRYDDDRLVRALLKHGADPLARCDRGRRPVDYALAAARDAKRLDQKGAVAIAELLRRATARAVGRKR